MEMVSEILRRIRQQSFAGASVKTVEDGIRSGLDIGEDLFVRHRSRRHTGVTSGEARVCGIDTALEGRRQDIRRGLELVNTVNDTAWGL